MLTLVYASETGNAEEVAYGLWNHFLSRGTPSEVRNVQDFTWAQLVEATVVVFLVSTTGDGDVPVSMKAFWPLLLRKSLAGSTLAAVRYAVFGLGDSTYQHYNAVARKLFVRLKQLGALPVVPLGLGDDQARHGYYTALDPWKAVLSDALRSLGLPQDPTVRPVPLEQIYSVRTGCGTATTTCEYYCAGSMQLLKNERLTAADWPQNVRLISLSCPAGVSYEVGDICWVCYENSPKEVDGWLTALCLRGDEMLQIDNSSANGTRPSRLRAPLTCTTRALFSRFLGIGAVARRELLAFLATLARAPEEAAKLAELASPQGTDLYYDYCLREKRTPLEVLRDFASVKLTAADNLTGLLAVLPALAPRPYSIASAPRPAPLGLPQQQQQMDLVVAIATYRTPRGKKRCGVATSYLSSLTPGAEVVCRITSGPLRNSNILRTPRKPIVLIGPGTGVAPMRGIIQHFACTTDEVLPPPPPDRASAEVAELLLFRGIRKTTADYYFAQEWAALPFLEVVLATSQEVPRAYVQHRIRDEGARVAALLLKGAGVYVVGAAKAMPLAVRQALRDALCLHGGMDEAAAEAFLADMLRNKRYLVEAWS